MKLFNWNKPGFPPCGLLNCGNRYEYAILKLSVLPLFGCFQLLEGHTCAYLSIYFSFIVCPSLSVQLLCQCGFTMPHIHKAFGCLLVGEGP